MTDRNSHNARYGGRHSPGSAGAQHQSGHDAGRDPLWGLPDPDTQAEFYADVPMKRAIAWVVDTGLILVLTVLAGLMTVGIGFFFFFFIFFVMSFAYRVVTLANSSATLGMRLTAIEIRRAGGEKLDLPTAVLHTIGYHVSVGVVLLQVISIVLMLTTARGQGLTDHLLGTAAINRAARS